MKVVFVTFLAIAATVLASPVEEREDANALKFYFPEDNETCISTQGIFVCHEGQDADATVVDGAADANGLAARSSPNNNPTIEARFCPGCPTRCDWAGYCKSGCIGTWGVCKCYKKKVAGRC